MTSKDKTKNVSLQASEKMVDEFDRALKQAQLNGDIELDTSRSEALRRLMMAAIDNPSLFGEVDE